jgi:hypothetical protein
MPWGYGAKNGAKNQAHKRLPPNLLPLSISASIYNLKATISFSMTFSLMGGKSHPSWVQFCTVSFWKGS